MTADGPTTHSGVVLRQFLHHRENTPWLGQEHRTTADSFVGPTSGFTASIADAYTRGVGHPLRTCGLSQRKGESLGSTRPDPARPDLYRLSCPPGEATDATSLRVTRCQRQQAVGMSQTTAKRVAGLRPKKLLSSSARRPETHRWAQLHTPTIPPGHGMPGG